MPDDAKFVRLRLHQRDQFLHVPAGRQAATTSTLGIGRDQSAMGVRSLIGSKESLSRRRDRLAGWWPASSVAIRRLGRQVGGDGAGRAGTVLHHEVAFEGIGELLASRRR